MEDNKEIKTAAGNIPSAEEQDKNRRKRKTARAALSFGIMVLLLVILFFAAVNIGSLKVTFPQLFRGIFLEPDETVSAIFDLRFPRIMISMLAGAAVAVSGVLFQAVLKNPLADPGIIGISSGASFAAVIITAAAPTLFFFTPLFAFLGGVLAFFLVYTLSWKGELSSSDHSGRRGCKLYVYRSVFCYEFYERREYVGSGFHCQWKHYYEDLGGCTDSGALCDHRPDPVAGLRGKV